MAKYSQASFNGGIDLFTERTRLGPDKYPLLINARSRYGKLRAINKPARIDEGLPGGRMQGLYAAGAYAIAFANGYAFLRNYDREGSTFVKHPTFAMDASAKEMFMELVPASTINYARTLTTDDEPQSGISLGANIAPSPVAAVVQDGLTQPWIILSNGEARVTLNYDQWQSSANGREYVPVGKQMVFSDGKLWIASVDGKQIYQSVSGRPLDFMVVVDMEGNKLPLETDGGAANVSHRVSYDTITALGRVSSVEGGFYVGSLKNSFLVIPNNNATAIYGELQLINRYIAATGPTNHRSFLGDVNGDSVFVDTNGVRSFNAILQFRNSGKNSPFSLPLTPLFRDIIQASETTCVGQFDNYSMYALDTTYGQAVLWYDELRNVWDAIDIWDSADVEGTITQFAEVILSTGEHRLLFRTDAGRVYEYFGSSTVANAKAYLGDWNTGDPQVETAVEDVSIVLSRPSTAGTVQATLYVDTKQCSTISRAIPASAATAFDTSALPFADSGKDAIINNIFSFLRCPSGFQFGLYLEWNIAADITHVSVDTQEMTNTTNVQQQIAEHASVSAAIRNYKSK